MWGTYCCKTKFEEYGQSPTEECDGRSLSLASRNCQNNEYQKSLIYFKKTIELNSKYEKAYNNIGNTLNELGEYDQATNAYKQAIKIKPDYSIAYSNLLFNLNYKTNFK